MNTCWKLLKYRTATCWQLLILLGVPPWPNLSSFDRSRFCQGCLHHPYCTSGELHDANGFWRSLGTASGADSNGSLSDMAYQVLIQIHLSHLSLWLSQYVILAELVVIKPNATCENPVKVSGVAKHQFPSVRLSNGSHLELVSEDNECGKSEVTLSITRGWYSNIHHHYNRHCHNQI